MKNRKNNRKGFTIVELVIVIAVIAILAGVLIPTFANVIKKAQTSAILQEAQNAYKEAYALAITDGKIETQTATAEAAVPGTETQTSGDYRFTFTTTDSSTAIDEIDTVTVTVKANSGLENDGYIVTVDGGEVKVEEKAANATSEETTWTE